MQTFLPYPDFDDSARVLDYRRLGKQRVEARQILRAISGSTYGWQSHLAVRMWRGYQHNMGYFDVPENYSVPLWLGHPAFHYSHRSMLFQKSPRDYVG